MCHGCPEIQPVDQYDCPALESSDMYSRISVEYDIAAVLS